MNTILYRYLTKEHEYLVYDQDKNKRPLDSHAVRAICSRNCGISAKGILAGQSAAGGAIEVRFYLPDGSLARSDRETDKTWRAFLADSGCLVEDGPREPKRTGTIFLSEDFVF